jgi:radical SAM-linked protein
MAVEVARGCTEGCRFCQAGMIYRPVRERDPVAVIDALVGGVKKGGYDETSLTSLSTADYSCVTPLVKAAMARLRDEKVSLSVSSLRAYGLNEDLLAEMASVRAGGLTFAPEAGTQRMRDVITKNVTEDDIIQSAQRVFGRGFQRMKLYFMIGLPTEEEADVRGIVETAARVQEIGRRHLRAAEVTASVSTHVPKPHTPFQWAAMDGEDQIAGKQALLAEMARRLRVGLKMHENRQSHIEGIFSRGDRAVADLLEAAFRKGCRFDGWDDQLRVDLWDEAIEETGVDVGRYLGTIPVTARLPWDHIDIGLEPGFLVAEYRKALKDRLSPPCGKPYKQLLHPSSVAAAEAAAGKKLVCYDCGVACDLQAMKDERLYFLRRMNAWGGEAPPPLPVVTTPPRSGRRPAPPTRITQGIGRRYRLRYAKLGRAAYLGHLDLVRHLPRIFRRAGLELFYSLGFHPKPEISFGPALGLGIPSLGEICDITLVDDVAPDELEARLAAVTLPGIEIGSVVRLGDGDRALGRVIAEAELVARLPAGVDVGPALARLGGDGGLTVRRASDKPGAGIARTVDVRRSLRAVGAFEDLALRERLDWPGDGALVRFAVAISAEGNARPAEVIEALWDADVAAGADFARLALWASSDGGARVDPLDAPALRRRAPAAAEVGLAASPAS